MSDFFFEGKDGSHNPKLLARVLDPMTRTLTSTDKKAAALHSVILELHDDLTPAQIRDAAVLSCGGTSKTERSRAYKKQKSMVLSLCNEKEKRYRDVRNTVRTKIACRACFSTGGGASKKKKANKTKSAASKASRRSRTRSKSAPKPKGTLLGQIHKGIALKPISKPRSSSSSKKPVTLLDQIHKGVALKKGRRTPGSVPRGAVRSPSANQVLKNAMLLRRAKLMSSRSRSAKSEFED